MINYPNTHMTPSFPKYPFNRLGLYAVVDHLTWLEYLAQLGVRMIQLRLKNQSLAQIRSQVILAREICAQHQVKLYLNDYWQLAIEQGIHGVHLGQEDMDTADFMSIHKAGLYLGLSTHNHAEAERAMTLNPSYIALGPIFPTSTKAMPFAPQGIARLREWIQRYGTQTAICAIGGINSQNFIEVAQTGVNAIAMVNGLRPEQPHWENDWLLYQQWQTWQTSKLSD